MRPAGHAVAPSDDRRARRLTRAAVVAAAGILMVALVWWRSSAPCSGRRSTETATWRRTRPCSSNFRRYRTLRFTSTNSFSYGADDGSPVIGYTTLYFFALPSHEVAAFYERELHPEWTLVEKLEEDPPRAAGPILNFRKGTAFISTNFESDGGGVLEIAVDHGSMVGA